VKTGKSPVIFIKISSAALKVGLDYASPEEKYLLKNLPGKAMSGLQLMCIMYAGFKQLDPEVDPEMDLEDEYQQALGIWKTKK
jgi:hypothetical protein